MEPVQRHHLLVRELWRWWSCRLAPIRLPSSSHNQTHTHTLALIFVPVSFHHPLFLLRRCRAQEHNRESETAETRRRQEHEYGSMHTNQHGDVHLTQRNSVCARVCRCSQWIRYCVYVERTYVWCIAKQAKPFSNKMTESFFCIPNTQINKHFWIYYIIWQIDWKHLKYNTWPT